MNKPTLSLVICAYNEELFLERCLRSIRNQKTSFAFETILVNDASEDKTLQVAEAFEMENLRIMSNSQRQGIGKSSNIGLMNAQGRYVVRVDADDYVSEHFVELLTVAIIELGSNAVKCDYFEVDASGKELGIKNSAVDPIACGIVFKKDSLVQVGLYNSDLWVKEDEELEARFLKSYKINHVAVPLYRYRQHDGNSSRGQKQDGQ